MNTSATSATTASAINGIQSAPMPPMFPNVFAALALDEALSPLPPPSSEPTVYLLLISATDDEEEDSHDHHADDAKDDVLCRVGGILRRQGRIGLSRLGVLGRERLLGVRAVGGRVSAQGGIENGIER